MPDIELNFISEDALLLVWPEHICRQQHQSILRVAQAITQQLGDKVIDSLASFNSLLIYYRYQQVSAKALATMCQRVINHSYQDTQLNSTIGSTITIPAYYGENAAWDLAEVMQATGLNHQQIIKLHTSTTYHVFALGFTPGFGYLASLDKQLRLPRKNTPRKRVPSGAIAIADKQTAIYPDTSPGGWHIIGQTPKPMYQVTQTGITTTLQVGDTVKFHAIDEATFISLGGQVSIERN